MRKPPYWGVAVFSIWRMRHVVRHGHLLAKMFRVYVLNEMHTRSYTCPRLQVYL